MRLSIRHELCHKYEPPARSVIHNLRLTPRSHDGQHVVHWRIDVDVECRLKASQDAFGNIVHRFSSDGPHSELTVTAIGEIETFDTRGVVAGGLERLPTELYLRPTSATQPTAETRALVDRATKGEVNELDRLHALLRALPDRGSPQASQMQQAAGQSQSQLAPSEALAPADLAHTFIACSRLLEIPARIVAGYRLPDAPATLPSGHFWAEAYVPRLGWVGFDPAHGVCPDERYVRVAIGLDALGVSVTRAAHAGGADSPSEVRLTVTQAQGLGRGA
jgi:transglutaminase-like putative cysteine protease